MRNFPNILSIQINSANRFLISDRMKYVRFASTDAVYYRRFRKNSALTMKRSKIRLAENSLRLMREYTKIFFFQYVLL